MLELSHKDGLLFAFDDTRNILQEKDMAIKNNKITTGIRYSSVLGMDGLWAPPYVSSNFKFDMRLLGETIKTNTFMWLPFAIERNGSIAGVSVYSLFTFGARMRTAIIHIKLVNNNISEISVPIQVNVQGGVDYVHFWEFATAVGEKNTDLFAEPKRLLKLNNDKAVIIASSMKLKWFALASLWEGEVHLEAGQSLDLWFAVSIGSDAEALEESDAVMADPQQAVDHAVQGYEDEVQQLFTCFPHLESDNKHLVHFYNRSLMHYITNKWEIDEFVLKPYYSTGGLRGGCVGSYLYDFSAGWQTHAIYDPQMDKKQIKRYLLLDISKCFAFNPVDGCAFGPWYPVNQEKIIGLIYYYIKNTGDIAFLSEETGGKTVYEWVIWNALLKDDVSKPVSMIDYGIDGEHHLELRRGIPYHGVLPDLNGRRYMNYLRAYELSKLAERPCDMLLDRAAQLKALLKKELWNAEAKWFDFITAGKRDTRYTIQMFKLLSSPVLDSEEEAGLLSHLNEAEFLSGFGIHSMSKLDQAYDQVDIDNGGGGACSIFAPLISEKLYRAGKGGYADEIMRKVLWWGERVPYWGDSFVANYMDYRQDTPLQCTIGGVAGAQCILFGMFGVDAQPDGTITINPHLPAFCHEICFKGLMIHRKRIDVSVNKEGFSVTCNGKTVESRPDHAIVC